MYRKWRERVKDVPDLVSKRIHDGWMQLKYIITCSLVGIWARYLHVTHYTYGGGWVAVVLDSRSRHKNFRNSLDIIMVKAISVQAAILHSWSFEGYFRLIVVFTCRSEYTHYRTLLSKFRIIMTHFQKLTEEEVIDVQVLCTAAIISRSKLLVVILIGRAFPLGYCVTTGWHYSRCQKLLTIFISD